MPIKMWLPSRSYSVGLVLYAKKKGKQVSFADRERFQNILTQIREDLPEMPGVGIALEPGPEVDEWYVTVVHHLQSTLGQREEALTAAHTCIKSVLARFAWRRQFGSVWYFKSRYSQLLGEMRAAVAEAEAKDRSCT